ncbi:CrcB family protein [Streptomonospora sp. S1-112]|uniref:Fluoride-specific ion channel FluC n=1 Tax=Streptomonospora mangrovi TaxID=2883123 RepID=A0A9X3SPH0_9ACTN|nr:CrcB family protein [Streptomonospora mangrovi]MDA0565886.1 CrcB family protein [Streptomonospora mangrovi]
MTVLLAALGAAIGAPLRYLTDTFVGRATGSALPWGTLTVNAAACLLLGAVTALTLPAWASALVATGVLGGLSTYSAFGYETFALLRAGRRLLALANAAVSIAVGLAALTAGLAAGAAFTG